MTEKQTVAKLFPAGTTIKEAIKEILNNSDDLVKGAVLGTLGMLELTPYAGVNLSTVVDVIDYSTGKTYDGYMISITPDEDSAIDTYERVCGIALVQRFIGLDENGRAIKFLAVNNGRTVEHFKEYFH